ncbi:MAG: hypothetical protein ACK44A_03980 [Roseateles sp.]
MSNLVSNTAGQSRAAVLRPLALSLALLAPAPTLWAQTRPADPADPQARVPEFRYVGALSRYRPLQEAPMASWQQANEKTHQAGGWRAYAREKLAEEPAQPDAPAKGQAPHKSHGHHHHHGKH